MLLFGSSQGAAPNSAIYYHIAKRIRSRIDFQLFIVVGHVIAMLFTFLYAIAVLPWWEVMSPQVGALGWLTNGWKIFAIQICSSILSDVVGTLGLCVIS